MRHEEGGPFLWEHRVQFMKTDGTPYPANSLHLIACGLVPHFRDNMKRFDLNILSKEEANFDSFRKAPDSRMKEVITAGVGTKKQRSDPLSNEEEAKLWFSRTAGLHSCKSLKYGVCFYNFKDFGFRTMNEQVNLMAE